jgi:hypothetical protein
MKKMSIRKLPPDLGANAWQYMVTHPVKYVPKKKQRLKELYENERAFKKLYYEENKRLRDALIWCSGSGDFQVGGIAREGWEKICIPLLTLKGGEEGYSRIYEVNMDKKGGEEWFI